MSQEPEALGAVSWRRRHPVLARGLLYGVGVALVALVVLLLNERGKVDRQDHLDYLEARFGALDVLARGDATGDQVESFLDEVFAVPDLPVDLLQRALRARSLNHVKRGEADAALADLDAAADLVLAPVDREALQLERAQVLIGDGRAEEARALLAGLEISSHPALVIWRALLQTRALRDLQRDDDALLALDGALARLPRPLPGGAPALFSLTPWSASDAAIQATLALAELAPRPLGAGPWLRLLELAPQDLQGALQAARALHQGGHAQEAARAWAWAVSLNGGRVPKGAASDPDLAALEKKRVEGLKAEDGGGR